MTLCEILLTKNNIVSTNSIRLPMQFENAYGLKLFKKLLRIRRIEEAIVDEYPRKKMRSPVHLSMGQEAPAVAICSQLTKQDSILSNHRPHAHYLAKGGNLEALIAELYGKQSGCTSGRGGSMHLADLHAGFYGSAPIPASTIPIGIGIAFAASQKEDPPLTAIFFGEGATEEGIYFESLNFAAVKKLPILFVCENNYLSSHTSLSSRQSAARDNAKIAEGLGLFASSGDGSDMETCYRLSKTAIDHIKNGEGPTYLEFKTFRQREHCGTKVSTKNAPVCPLKHFKDKLTKVNMLTIEILEEMEEAISNEIQLAFEKAKNAPLPQFDFDDEDVFVRNV